MSNDITKEQLAEMLNEMTQRQQDMCKPCVEAMKELLKTFVAFQKPVEVKGGGYFYYCECGFALDSWDIYCGRCGRKLDWSKITL